MALAPLDQVTESLSAGMDPMETAPQAVAPPPPYASKERVLELFNRFKAESLDQRWVLEHDWLRDLSYVAGRQWIIYHPARREWVDKKLHKWIPRPVTNKMRETVNSIRSTFAAVNLVAKARPAGYDSKAIAAAEIADQMAPLIHEEHDMNQVMREADFWLITTGNAVLQTSWDLDVRSNRLFVKSEQCAQCGQVYPPEAIVAAGHTCPDCGSPNFTDAVGPDGKPQGEWKAHGKGKTQALSPFEYAFPLSITRWDELPYIIRLRWRDKSWFEANKPDLVNTIQWEKASTDRSLQLYRSLALSNSANTFQGTVTPTGSQSQTEGVTEYELWLKPTPEFPQGLVARIVGGSSPIVIDVPEESIPGPFPYTDIESKPLFPFFFAQYEHVGGRLYGSGAISPLIQKQDQINQMDSMSQLIVQRMANPVWVIPENAGIEHFSGEPGLIMKWNPLAAGGTSAKPDKVEGSDIPSSIPMLREQGLKDIEEISGAYDIIKGQKPTGVEAFSALQLLVERSQSRFTTVFQARGEMYRRWYSFALEMERQFGPEQRTMTILAPNRGYTFKHFQNAQLQGQIQIVIEDGSTMPKTSLGKRAAMEQAFNFQLLNVQDPDQRYMLLSNLGLQDLVPTLNVHVQTALRIQDEFEEWARNPQGLPPLTMKPWYDAQVHWTERIKWLNTDRMKELFTEQPELEPIIYQHLAELQMILTPPAPVEGEVGPDGEPTNKTPGGQAMNNSNKAGGTGAVPKGNGEGAQRQGPV
jgi:predicted Zn-ribbon and HTH transcriptional regulator